MFGLKKRHDQGVSEIGVVISIIVVALTVVAVAAAFASYTKITGRSSLQTQAADAAQSVFEQANATPWNDLALSSSDANIANSHVVALAGDKSLVTKDAGAFTAFKPTPAKVEGGTENYGTINKRFTVYTAITWEKQPAISITTGNVTNQFGTKRISVEVVWGDGMGESQTFTSLRTPSVGEAVPSNVNVVAGGGLTVERDINDPVLSGDPLTGKLTATITKAYKWEIQMSRYTDFSSYETLCSGEYSDIRDSTETCTYTWKSTIGFTPSFRVKVTTLDTDDSQSSAGGIKYSNVVTFPGPEIPDLTGGKTAWNKDQIFWEPTKKLLNVLNTSATVETAIHRVIAGNDVVTVVPYDTSGGTKVWTTAEGESATYQVCTLVNSTPVACSNVFGPLYTITTPLAPTVTGVRPSGSVFYANYTWGTTSDSYTGDGGSGISYDVEQQNADGTWTTLYSKTSLTALNNINPKTKTDSYLQTTVTLRVRVWNDSGFGPWTTVSTTVGELPTAPTISVTALAKDGSGGTKATFSWTAATYAYNGYEYSYSKNSGTATTGTVAATGTRSLTYTGVKGDSGTLKVRSVNQFGASAYATNTVAFDGAPATAPTVTVTPQQGKVLVSWAAVTNATGYEVQYWVNGTLINTASCTSSASDGASTISWCVASATLSVTFDSTVDEGDKVIVRVRGYNAWGDGPWSAKSTKVTATMRSVAAVSVTGDPHLSGGKYTWPALTCDSGNTAQYAVYDDGAWGAWGTTRSYIESFNYGASGTVYVKQRCINGTTSVTSTGAQVTATVGWRLLSTVSSYTDYTVSMWTSNNWKRLEQVLKVYQSSGKCSSSSYVSMTVSGSNFGRNPVDELKGDFNDKVKVFQCWLNARDGSSNGNIDVDGYWGPLTTNKLRSMLAYRCTSISTSTTTSSTNAFDEYEMHRLTHCLNSGEY